MDYTESHSNEAEGFLLFSESKIEITISENEKVSGSFTIEEQGGMEVEGDVYSSNLRMHVDSVEINGTSAEVFYTFDSVGMNVGDVQKGNFYVVFNMGEYVLPYVIMVQRAAIDSSMGNIKNLFHFTNLAKSNWQEAVEVFYNPDFEYIMSGNESKYRNLYRGLSNKGNKNCNLEEFLVGINKKQKIEYLVSDEPIVLMNPTSDLNTIIDIERNGWGYTLISVKADGDFIIPDMNRITEKDFEGNVCHFGFCIDETKMHDGKNFGSIEFRHLYGSFSVKVCATRGGLGRRSIIGKRQKSNTFAFVRHYLDYTSKKISLQKWLVLSEELLSTNAMADADIGYSLMRAHIMLINERYNEAKWILDKKITPAIMENESNELYCYYQYMLALYNNDDYFRKETASRIHNIYEKDKTNWRIAWILLKLSDDLKKTPEKKFGFAMEQIRFGCISPVIYIEALKALSENPAMLMHLDECEIRVLRFGAKEGILSKDIMTQISYLALRAKTYNPALLSVLEYIYKKYDSDDVIQAICVQLMKCEGDSQKNFEWYALAVDHNLPLTKLYESYMMAMDLRREIPIPKRVLMYFSYQSDLPTAQNAYLYAYVYKNRENFPEIYMSYKESMNRFVLRQLRAGKVDKNLAYLYSNLVTEELYSPENIRALADLVLLNCITVEDGDIANVIVIDGRLKEELVYPVVKRKANVAVIGNDHTILLEDAIGNRFYSTREYSTERFFMPGKLSTVMENNTDDSLLYDLYICDDSLDFLVVTAKNAARYQFLAKSEMIADRYRGRLQLPLIRYYLEKDDIQAADNILDTVVFDDISFRDYNEILRCFTGRGMYDKALDFAVHYGIENVEPKILIGLSDRIIEQNGFVADARILSMLIVAFEKGKYNETGLSYLAKFYKGPIKILRNIWKAASTFGVDTYEICERLIVQTLNTGAFIGEEAKVLKEYVAGGAKAEIEQQYLAYFAHEYFVHGRVVDGYIFEEIERCYQDNKENQEVCMLAYLKYFSSGWDISSFNEARKECIREFVSHLYTRNGILFSFFSAYKSISVEAMQISNQTIIEYRGTPGRTTTINYIYSKGDEESEGFCREKMVDMYGGIYVKSFLLFFGESLQYYITENAVNGEQLTESALVQKNEATGESDSDRYSIVNDIAIATTLKDYDTAFKLLEEYKYREYLTDNVFQPQ